MDACTSTTTIAPKGASGKIAAAATVGLISYVPSCQRHMPQVLVSLGAYSASVID